MVKCNIFDGELPEPKPVFVCDCCGGGIYPGEEFTFVKSGERYCADCTWSEYADVEEDENPYIDVEVHARLEEGI